jgi:hypothetical protein
MVLLQELPQSAAPAVPAPPPAAAKSIKSLSTEELRAEVERLRALAAARAARSTAAPPPPPAALDDVDEGDEAAEEDAARGCARGRGHVASRPLARQGLACRRAVRGSRAPRGAQALARGRAAAAAARRGGGDRRGAVVQQRRRLQGTPCSSPCEAGPERFAARRARGAMTRRRAPRGRRARQWARRGTGAACTPAPTATTTARAARPAPARLHARACPPALRASPRAECATPPRVACSRTPADGEWRRDLRHGRGTAVFTSGLRYEGDWRDDKAHGHGAAVYANGDKARSAGRGALQRARRAAVPAPR